VTEAAYQQLMQYSVDPAVGDFVCHFEDALDWCPIGATSPRWRLVIDKADPRVVLAAGFLDHIRSGSPASFGAAIEGDVLRVKASNRTVIYRIAEKTPDGLAYYAEWPD
jgi:hypothetical protein